MAFHAFQISFGPSKFIPVSMAHLSLPEAGTSVSESQSCGEDSMRWLLNFTDPSEARLSRNLTVDFASRRDEAGNILPEIIENWRIIAGK